MCATPAHPSPASWLDCHERLVEISEANAYAALIDAVPDDRLQRQQIGSAMALSAPSTQPTLILNRALSWGITEDATPEQLDALCAFYQRQGTLWGLELSPAAAPEELSEWLKARRLRKRDVTAMLLRACEPIPEAQCALEIRLWRPEDGDAAAQLASQLFKVPELITQRLCALPHHPRWRQWVACDRGQIVATSLLYLGPADPHALGHGVAWGGWGATLEAYRGQGLHRALMAARLRDAAAHGCRWLSSETALGSEQRPDQSHRNLLRLGFAQVSVRHTYIGLPSRTSARATPTS